MGFIRNGEARQEDVGLFYALGGSFHVYNAKKKTFRVYFECNFG